MLSQYLFCRNKIFHILGIKTFLSNLRIRGAKKAKNIPGRYPIRRMKKISDMLRLRRKNDSCGQMYFSKSLYAAGDFCYA